MQFRGLVLALITLSAGRAADPAFEQTSLWQSNVGGYAMYRIPGLIVTDRGTVLAYCEARRTAGSDWGKIDIHYRRSTDGGKTFDAPRSVPVPEIAFEKNPVAVKQKLGTAGDITFNNPVMIEDRGIVHLLYCVEYMRCFYCRSDDDGATFSKPVEVTSACEPLRKDYPWKVMATGPGHGIRQSKTGRLIVPVWLSTGEGGHAHRPSAVTSMYSDDQGKSWKAGTIVVNHPTLTNPSETAAVELSDGRVMFNIRHESAPHQRAVTRSGDGASGWESPTRDPALPEPICMGSLARIDAKTIAFSNPHNADNRERRNLTVKLSNDDGTRWPAGRAVEPGFSGYSDLAVSADGRILCFYERNGDGSAPARTRSLMLARFRPEWVRTKPVRIVALGDSITKGYRPGVHDEETFSARLTSEFRRRDIAAEVYNVGIGGETTAQALKRLPAVLALKPQYVTVMYGANDSYIDKGKTDPRVSIDDFGSNLVEICRQISAAGAMPILMTTNRYGDKHPPDGSGKHPHAQMERYMAVVRFTAHRGKVPLVDHETQWINKHKGGADIEKWMTDSVHPNPKGQQEMADLMLPGLLQLITTKEAAPKK